VPLPAPPAAVKGVLGVDHVALTVDDLDASTRFYQELGSSLERHLTFEGEGAEYVTGVARASLQMAFLALGDFRLELIRFSPPGKEEIRAGNDRGSAHICLRVQDIEGVYSRLTARGVSFTSPPYHHPSGVSMTYFADPEGNPVELLEVRTADGA
jgi:catechol 2,3-dioxygenase-like lactoylglutathione lyase family enzyme